MHTGVQHSVKDFINLAAKYLEIKIDWRGNGINETGYTNGVEIVKVDKRYFRPTEVDTFARDSTKARKKLNWSPKTTFEQLVKEMVEKDLKLANEEKFKKIKTS